MKFPSEITPAQRTNQASWRTTSSRWMASPTPDVKSYIVPVIVFESTNLVSAVLLFTVALHESTIDRRLLYFWFAEAILNIVVRESLFAWMTRQTTEDFINKPAWRFLPPFLGFVLGCHWVWTTTIFVGPEVDLVTLTALLVFVLMSVACMAMVVASPAAAVTIVLSIWIPTAIRLWAVPSLHQNAFVAVWLVSIVAILWTSWYLAISHVRRFVLKSDQVIQHVDKLWDANTELDRMRAQTATELQNRSHFFSGASHDFAQRLHGLKLLARATQEETRASSVSLRKMSEALEDLEIYVRDVLEFARLEGATLKPALSPTRLQDVFQQLLLHFESIAQARGADLRIRTTRAVVETDQAMLLRILENIVSNAIKFTRKGVLVAARRRGNGWIVEVWDQGPGIAMGDEAAIFQAFYQNQSYADRRREGVGLGLAIVRRIADSLKYEIGVRAREGRGTVMTIRGLRAASADARVSKTVEPVLTS